MGTRSITRFKTETGETLMTMYKQYDGYPSGLGNRIKEILGSRELVNGYNDAKTQINGLGCAAALLVSSLKGDDAGGVYIVPSTDDNEEFAYNISIKDDALSMEVFDYDDKVIYDGPISEFDGDALDV